MMELSAEVHDLLQRFRTLSKQQDDDKSNSPLQSSSQKSNMSQTSSLNDSYSSRLHSDDIINVDDITFDNDEDWLFTSRTELPLLDGKGDHNLKSWLYEKHRAVNLFPSPCSNDASITSAAAGCQPLSSSFLAKKAIDTRTFTRPKKKFPRPSLSGVICADDVAEEPAQFSSNETFDYSTPVKPLHFDLTQPMSCSRIFDSIAKRAQDNDSFQNMSPPSLVNSMCSSTFTNLMENSYIKNDPVLREIRDADFSLDITNPETGQAQLPQVVMLQSVGGMTESFSSLNSDSAEAFLRKTLPRLSGIEPQLPLRNTNVASVGISDCVGGSDTDDNFQSLTGSHTMLDSGCDDEGYADNLEGKQYEYYYGAPPLPPTQQLQPQLQAPPTINNNNINHQHNYTTVTKPTSVFALRHKKQQLQLTRYNNIAESTDRDSDALSGDWNAADMDVMDRITQQLDTLSLADRTFDQRVETPPVLAQRRQQGNATFELDAGLDKTYEKKETQSAPPLQPKRSNNNGSSCSSSSTSSSDHSANKTLEIVDMTFDKMKPQHKDDATFNRTGNRTLPICDDATFNRTESPANCNSTFDKNATFDTHAINATRDVIEDQCDDACSRSDHNTSSDNSGRSQERCSPNVVQNGTYRRYSGGRSKGNVSLNGTATVTRRRHSRSMEIGGAGDGVRQHDTRQNLSSGDGAVSNGSMLTVADIDAIVEKQEQSLLIMSTPKPAKSMSKLFDRHVGVSPIEQVFGRTRDNLSDSELSEEYKTARSRPDNNRSKRLSMHIDPQTAPKLNTTLDRTFKSMSNIKHASDQAVSRMRPPINMLLRPMTAAKGPLQPPVRMTNAHYGSSNLRTMGAPLKGSYTSLRPAGYAAMLPHVNPPKKSESVGTIGVESKIQQSVNNVRHAYSGANIADGRQTLSVAPNNTNSTFVKQRISGLPRPVSSVTGIPRPSSKIPAPKSLRPTTAKPLKTNTYSSTKR